MIEDLIIIIPTHKRHAYLLGKINYYSEFPCHVYICDSTPEEYKGCKDLPANIHYIWCPEKGFYHKVMSILEKTDGKFYNLTPDDDFLDLNTLIECYNKMSDDSRISLSVGKQVSFNKPFDGKFRSGYYGNLLHGKNLMRSKRLNVKILARNYQNILWSLFRKDIILRAFEKLTKINPENGNFVELTLAIESCVGGLIYVSPEPYNYREFTTEMHWGKQVPSITLKDIKENDRMKLDMDKIISCYSGKERKIAKSFVHYYLYQPYSLQRIWNSIKFHVFGIKPSYSTEVAFNEKISSILTNY